MICIPAINAALDINNFVSNRAYILNICIHFEYISLLIKYIIHFRGKE